MTDPFSAVSQINFRNGRTGACAPRGHWCDTHETNTCERDGLHMAATDPMMGSQVAAALFPLINTRTPGSFQPVRVQNPDGVFLGTVGEVGTDAEATILYTVKYENAPCPDYDEWDVYGDDQTGVMLFHTTCRWAQMFLDGGVVQLLELIRDHSCSVMEGS